MAEKKDPRLVAFARENRKFDNPTAKRVWGYLRARRANGFKWRREQIIGPYIVDFWCAAAQLVIELDGDSHVGTEAYDQRKDQFLELQGIEVIRVSNVEANEQWQEFLDHVCCRARSRVEELGISGEDYRVT